MRARVLVLLCLALVLVGLTAAPALAASTYSEASPAPGSTTATTKPLISVRVSDPAGISGGAQIKLDGVSKTPKVTWVNSTTCILSYQVPTALKNGTHTVYASVFTFGGRTSTTWTFTSRVAPVLGPLSPADGSVVTTQRPEISAVVGTNGVALSSWSVVVDGAAVAASYDSVSKTLSYTPPSDLQNDATHSVAMTVTDASGASTSVAWSFGVQIYADMGDTAGCTDCHLAYPTAHPMSNCLACHDGSAPFPAYWNMDSASPHSAAMLDGIDCRYCHSSVFPTVPRHPEDLAANHLTTDDMSGCSCHVHNLTIEHNRWTDGEGAPLTCAACHGENASQTVKDAVAAGARSCAACHGAALHASVHEATIAADCASCHVANLQSEHTRVSSSSAGAGCANCHPTPRDGLSGAWNKGCSQSGSVHLGGGCHMTGGPAQMHLGQMGAHTVAAEASACTAAGCHDDGIEALHAGASVTDPAGTRTGCNVCHTPSTMPSTTNCKTCHTDKVDPETGDPTSHGFSAEAHTAADAPLSGTWPAVGDNATYNPAYNYSATCDDCHDLLISTQHGGVCATCHPTPRSSFGTWDKSCTQSGCHTIASSAHDAGNLTAHAMGTADITAGCGFVGTNGRRPCHYRDLVQEHNRTINLRINPATSEPTLKTISVSCVSCHNSAAFGALDGAWDGSCNACHDGTTLVNHSIVGSARYNAVHDKHNNPAGYYDNGIGNTGANAMDAHGWIRPNPDQNSANKTIGCGAPTCHTQGYIGGGWPYYTAACAGCHGANIAVPDPYQGSYSWYSDYWFDDESMDTKLTMTLDPITLPAGSSLDFKTWYDIEKDWDYGYIQVSTNGGATWTNLPANITTNENPYGVNLGNGITGASGGWVDGNVDLSAYAGQTVRIRFAYIGDFYTYGLGWMLDVISVGPPGAPVFYDDCETLKPEMSVETYVTYYDYDLEDYVTAPTSLTGWKRFTR